VDRYQVYVGCRNGNLYALDRHTGEVVWSKGLQAPVLASPMIDINPKNRTGEVLYAIGSTGVLEAISPTDGAVYWAVNFRELLEVPYVNAVSTPTVIHETFRGKPSRRVLVGMGFGPSAAGTPTARLYCWRDVSE
jgi:outer membrane protein assembly factor BamB